jgi:hypothetical protein
VEDKKNNCMKKIQIERDLLVEPSVPKFGLHKAPEIQEIG